MIAGRRELTLTSAKQQHHHSGLTTLYGVARGQAGLMFWLRRKKFVGSYFFLIAASRS